jgi:hypothetical protein
LAWNTILPFRGEVPPPIAGAEVPTSMASDATLNSHPWLCMERARYRYPRPSSDFVDLSKSACEPISKRSASAMRLMMLKRYAT